MFSILRSITDSRINEPNRVDAIIVLASLRAEGTPRMALDLCKHWLSWGIRVGIIDLQRGSDDLQPMFEAMGVPIVSCRVGHNGYLRYLKLAWNTWRICRAWKPVSVLSMPSGLHAFISLGAKMAGVKQAIVHQGVYPFHWDPGFWKYRLEYRIGAQFTDRVVACSRYVREGVVEHFSVEAKKVVTIYNGVPFAGHEVRPEIAPAAGERPIVLMVGRIDATKDHSALVDASAVLSRRGVMVEFRFAGDGEQRAALEHSVAERGLRDRVRFLGVRNDIEQQLARTHLFIYSVRPEEGLGIALIEAMAAGVPVIASDVPACREVLDDGALGVLVPAGDGAAFADAIERVLSNPGEARRRAAAARQKVLEKFSAEKMARQYADVMGLTVPGRPCSPQ